MFGFKNFLASRTVWTQIIGLLAGMIAVWGIDLGPEEQAAIVTAIMSLWALGGILFRIFAKKQVTVGSPDRVEMSGRSDQNFR